MRPELTRIFLAGASREVRAPRAAGCPFRFRSPPLPFSLRSSPLPFRFRSSPLPVPVRSSPLPVPVRRTEIRRRAAARACASDGAATNQPNSEPLGTLRVVRPAPLRRPARSRRECPAGGAMASSAEEKPSMVSIWVCSRRCCSQSLSRAATATITRMTR